MKQRCYNQKTKQYKNYGARGIAVCDRWLESFDNFFADMGDKPDGMTLDRVNNDGCYEPSNCRWATKEEQQKNKRTTQIFEFDGKRMTMREWAKHLGVHETTLASRRNSGYPIELLLSPNKLLFGNTSAIAAMKEG
jgi:hypothetical protein